MKKEKSQVEVEPVEEELPEGELKETSGGIDTVPLPEMPRRAGIGTWPTPERPAFRRSR